MQFFTISQYFNKLSIALLAIILLPIIMFVVLYMASPADVASHPPVKTLTLSTVVLANWFLVFAYFNKKIKSIAKDQGLGLKLKKYFYLTIVRYMMIALVCMLIGYVFAS